MKGLAGWMFEVTERNGAFFATGRTAAGAGPVVKAFGFDVETALANCRREAQAVVDLPGWTFHVTEVSAGVYRATGKDASGHQPMKTPCSKSAGTKCDDRRNA